MTPGDLKRISLLWDVLEELPEQHRDAWLAALPAEDRRHVPALCAMLAQHVGGSSDNLTEGVPPLTVSADGLTEQAPRLAGQMVGPFCLQHFLGRGGMGEVWRARRNQGPVGRDVALKLPLMNARHPSIRQRFERECRILAGLNHAHIATLFEAGVAADGQAYMAMEYIDGSPLLRHCDDKALPLAARVTLALQLLDAVAYAHAQLVIHRDIKPANILVKPDGRLHLLDFGVAKLLDSEPVPTGQAASGHSPLTELAGPALTLEYASPEQVQHLPVGTASDIYSLGVVIYELLCGARPYRPRGAARRHLEEVMLTDDRPMASTSLTDAAALRRGGVARTLKRQLRGDLDTVLATALRLNPAQRYPTVAAMADDLRRWVKHQPILARPQSASYVTWRFVQRHALAIAAMMAVVLAIAVGAGVSVYQAQRAQSNEQLAQQQAARAQVVSSFLESVFRVNGRSGTDVFGARKLTARDLLDGGMARLLSDTTMAPGVRYDLLGTMGTIYREMGILEVSGQLARQRVTAAVQGFGESSIEHAQAWIDLAWTESVKGEGAEALTHARRARAVLVGLGEQPTEALATVWVRYAGVAADAGARVDVATIRLAVADGRRWTGLSKDLAALSFFQVNAGIFALQIGQRVEGLAAMREAMRLHDALGDEQRAKGYAIASWLGTAELYNGNLVEAKRRLESAIRYVDATTVAVEEQWVFQGLWRWHDVTGDLEQAWEVASIAVDKLAKLPDDLLTPEMGRPYVIAAKASWRSGRVELALQHLESARALHARKALPATATGVPQDSRLREPHPWVSAFIAVGRLDEAEELLGVHRKSLESEGGIMSFRALAYYLSGIELALVQENAARARSLLTEMRATGVNPADHVIYLGWTIDTLEAQILTLEGRWAESEKLLRKVLDAIRARDDGAQWRGPVAQAELALGRLLLVAGRADQARRPLRSAAEVFGQTQAPGLSLDRARALALLAKAEHEAGDESLFRKYREEVAAIWARHPTVKRRPDDRLAEIRSTRVAGNH